MEATIERPARVVNHATNAFKAPEEQPTAQELEAEMMAALMPQPPSLGDDDQAGEDDQQGTGEKNEQKQGKKPQDAESKQGKDGKPADQKKPQDGEQDQKQGGDQSQPQDGSEENGAEQQQGQQGESQDGEAGQQSEQASGDGKGQQGAGKQGSAGQADQSAECQLEPEDRKGLPDADAEGFSQKMVEKMLDALMGKQDEPEEQQGSGDSESEDQGRNNERGKAGEHGDGDGKPTGDAEHESFDNQFKDVGSEARVLSNKKGEKVETILTNAQAVEYLRVTNNNFGRNLFAKYRQFGKLTGEQMFWAHKIAMESLHPHYKTTLI